MGKKILVVDDNRQILDLIKVSLEEEGNVVITADDGMAGLSEWSKGINDIDLVISDNEMPILNGTEMVMLARKSDFRTPVIMFSSNCPPEIFGMTCVPKPDIDELFVKTRQLTR